jgi:hypothetical protein
MQSFRFDALARSLSQSDPPASRRTLLRVLGVGTLAGALVPAAGATAGGRAGPAKKGKGKGCKAGQRKCGKKCIPQDNCCKDADCNLCRDESCTKGTCGCGPQEIDHNGVCGKFPLCLTVSQLCERNDDCCSDHCDVIADNGERRCNRGIARCLTDFDCDPGFACRGFACTANPPCP